MIRLATLDDLDFIMEVARERYPEEIADWDEARSFALDALKCEFAVVIRGDFGFAMATLTRAKWSPYVKAHLIFVACRQNKNMEGYKLVRTLTEWAFASGAVEFKLSSGTDFELDAFAKRLGAKPERPSYYIPAPLALKAVA